ncbi:hypothetical protein ACTA71_000275 [Dictyostelium dimigraforme]
MDEISIEDLITFYKEENKRLAEENKKLTIYKEENDNNSLNVIDIKEEEKEECYNEMLKELGLQDQKETKTIAKKVKKTTTKTHKGVKINGNFKLQRKYKTEAFTYKTPQKLKKSFSD